MKKMIVCSILSIGLLLTACNSFVGEEGILKNNTVSGSAFQKTDQEPDVSIGREIPPLVTERIDTDKKGIEMPHMKKPSEISLGEDGSCYYIRTMGTGKNQIMTFYKDTGIRVCEVQIYKYGALWKKKYRLSTFVQFRDKFYVKLLSHEYNDDILLAIEMDTGKCEQLKGVKQTSNLIFYGDSIYDLLYLEHIVKYSLQGEKIETITLESKTEESRTDVQCIVDDKIYYQISDIDQDNAEIKRCDLDGNNRESLFMYKSSGGVVTEHMVFLDEGYIYTLANYGDMILKRIPLYGGKVEGYIRDEDSSLPDFSISNFSNFLITSDKLYFIGNGQNIYKLSKSPGEKPELFSDICCSKLFYTNGHIVIEEYNEKEAKMIEVLDEAGHSLSNFYARSYYWISEMGKHIYELEGTGLEQEDIDFYKKAKNWD